MTFFLQKYESIQTGIRLPDGGVEGDGEGSDDGGDDGEGDGGCGDAGEWMNNY